MLRIERAARVRRRVIRADIALAVGENRPASGDCPSHAQERPAGRRPEATEGPEQASVSRSAAPGASRPDQPEVRHGVGHLDPPLWLEAGQQLELAEVVPR